MANHSPKFIFEMMTQGGRHEDRRGVMTFNNNFDASQIKRMYTIENLDVNFVRGWQGHQIEQRWFASIKGSFEIQTLRIDDFELPSPSIETDKYILTNKQFDILHVAAGYLTAIRALENQSKLLVMADFSFNEIQDELRFPSDYFNQLNLN